MQTGRRACRNGRARSTARGNWVDCTPTRPTRASADHPDDPRRPDTAIGLVIGADADRHIGAEHLPPAGVLGEAVQAGECVRGDRRLDPPDRVAVVGVMRRLDQHQMKDRHFALRRAARREAGQNRRFQLNPSCQGEPAPLYELPTVSDQSVCAPGVERRLASAAAHPAARMLGGRVDRCDNSCDICGSPIPPVLTLRGGAA
jgi:hypothetical protein